MWFYDQCDSLNILVNSAAIGATPQGVTADGFELQLGTDHLNYLALTRGLMPALADEL